MLESQRIQIRLSELRAEINGWPEDGDIDRLAQLRAESLDLEGRLRAAIQEEAHRMEPEEPIEGAPPQERELNAIYHRASLGRMMDHLADGTTMDGAEAEFRAAIFPEGTERQGLDRVVPMHMFLPLDEGDIEVRADSVTTVGADDGVRTTRPIAARIFSRTDSAFVGATFLGVGAGRQRFPRLATGAALTYADESVEVDAQAGSVVHEDVDPVEATLAYVIPMSSGLRFGSAELENALRNDARQAITSGIDDTVLRGRPAVANVLTGGITGLVGSLTAPQAATDTLDAQAILQAYADRVDGRYAYTWMDSRILARHEVYGKGIFQAVGGATGERLLADLLPESMFRATARLAAPVGGVSSAISYAPMQDMSELLVPTWLDVGTIVDVYTGAGRRQTRVTFFLAHNVLLLRSEPWRLVSFKHT